MMTTTTNATTTTLVRAARAAREDGYDLRELLAGGPEERAHAAHYLLAATDLPASEVARLVRGWVVDDHRVLVDAWWSEEGCADWCTAYFFDDRMAALAEAIREGRDAVWDWIAGGIAAGSYDPDLTPPGEEYGLHIKAIVATPRRVAEVWYEGRYVWPSEEEEEEQE